MMTSHSRRLSTVAAIDAVCRQHCGAELAIYLTDDGSDDGTGPAAQALGVHVQHGDGSLYWAAGMAIAERAAWNSRPDFLLWLNDDVVLDDDAVSRLLAAYSERPGVVVGATRDPLTAQVTYGGRLRTSRWHPQRLVLVGERSGPVPVDTFNGNVVLIPAWARRLIGPIDDLYPHAYADDDYGYRAHAAGVAVNQAGGTIGICSVSDPAGLPAGRIAIWRARQQPKGLPWRAQARFLKRHGGRVWMVTFAAQQLKALVCGVYRPSR